MVANVTGAISIDPTPSQRLLLATSNRHKIDEIRAIFNENTLSSSFFTLVGLDELGLNLAEPIEDAPDFQGNAIIKARYYAQAVNMLCLADDSGLCVTVLNDEPGVRSARYAGQTGPRAVVDTANNQLLLKKLGETPIAKRQARFVCVMALCAPPPPETCAKGDDALPLIVRGEMHGRILTPKEATDPNHPERGRGVQGFGYDPLFVVRESNKTAAELPAYEKNRISHRGEAARQMLERLQAPSWR